MAPSHDNHTAKSLIHYLGRADDLSAASKSRITKNPKLRDFLVVLSENEPFIMANIFEHAATVCSKFKKETAEAAKKLDCASKPENNMPSPKRVKLSHASLAQVNGAQIASVTVCRYPSMYRCV